MRFFTITISALFLSACATQPPPPSQEELAQRQQALDIFKSLASSVAARPQPAAQAAPTPVTRQQNVTEQQLAQQINAVPSDGPQWAIFGSGPDGFKVNNQYYVVPEGRIQQFGFDEDSGDVTYFVNNGSGFTVKFARPTTNAQPIVIGHLTRAGNREEFRSVTGQVVAGSRIVPASRGVVAFREQTGFQYTPGAGVKNFVTPEGFHVAPFQNGDVASTGYILLEKDAQGDNPLANLAHKFGVSKQHDYALYHVRSGATHPIPVSLDDKDTIKLSGCAKKNNYVNECSRSRVYESLWNPDGSPNRSHPYWRIRWLNSKSGPLLITREGTLSRVVAVTQLNTGKKVAAFERLLGVNSFEIHRRSNGTLHMTAKLGFGSDKIDDLDSFIAAAPNIASAQ